MITNKRHLVFADAYKLTDGLTEDAIRCYQLAYPKASKEISRVNSYRLLQNATVVAYVNQFKDKERIEREENVIQTKKQIDSSNILQREKALEMTSNVAKILYNKIAKDKDKPKAQDVLAFNATVERLAKADGWDKPSKSEVKFDGFDITVE